MREQGHQYTPSPKPLKRLDIELHHPVIEFVKHTISPLSVALFIWYAGWSVRSDDFISAHALPTADVSLEDLTLSISLLEFFIHSFGSLKEPRGRTRSFCLTTEQHPLTITTGKKNLWSNTQAYYRSREIIRNAARNPPPPPRPKPTHEHINWVHGAGEKRAFSSLASMARLASLPRSSRQFSTLLDRTAASPVSLLAQHHGSLAVSANKYRLINHSIGRRALSTGAAGLSVCLFILVYCFSGEASSAAVDAVNAVVASPVTMSAMQVADAMTKAALPFHNAERTLGVYEPAVINDVLHHLIDVWSVVKVEELILSLHHATGTPYLYDPMRVIRM
jgi:hypothetical protein